MGILRAVVVQVQFAVTADPGRANTVARSQNDSHRSRSVVGIMVGFERDDFQGRIAAQVFMIRVQPPITEVNPRAVTRYLLRPGLAHIQPLPPGARCVEVMLARLEIGCGLSIFIGMVARHHGAAGQQRCQ